MAKDAKAIYNTKIAGIVGHKARIKEQKKLIKEAKQTIKSHKLLIKQVKTTYKLSMLEQ